jgi:hypothetical protein
MKRRISAILLAVLLIFTMTVTYAWLVLETVSVGINVPEATVTLDLEEDELNNAKQLVPNKFFWLDTQTDEYRYTIISTNFEEDLTDPQKIAFYQEMLNSYTISISGGPEELSLKEPVATANGIELIVFLDDDDFNNFGAYNNWRKDNTVITFGFVFTLIP